MALIELSDARYERAEAFYAIERSMWMRFLVMRLHGRTKARKLREFYGFGPEDVAELHSYKADVGEGLWFRLNDGRVFDAMGRRCIRDRAAYRQVPAKGGGASAGRE